ncbi:hypothetical protein FRX31_016368 [Thalictrum thalictroides]|uniref:Uncharacterized protein n=1 Tax=Thalictrum thalictroides TaxID=46969 RepID=A0A7J6WCD9_THATH|nr:hypothetical protein FRX31_016368 [Thalictrum thalictroides]
MIIKANWYMSSCFTYTFFWPIIQKENGKDDMSFDVVELRCDVDNTSRPHRLLELRLMVASLQGDKFEYGIKNFVYILNLAGLFVSNLLEVVCNIICCGF